MSIQKANQRRATDKEACKLFRNFLGAEAKFIKSLEENIRTCGFPGDAIKQANERHAETEQVGKQICEAAGLSLTPGSTGDFWWLGARMPGR
jgi:hypothetical protein